jgi:hypothetical protein
MFDRSMCMMKQVYQGKIYCDYFDAFCFECADVKDCPEEEEYEDYEEYYFLDEEEWCPF